MVETVACPQCGASNVADAEWCGQCYSRLVVAPTAAPAIATPPTDEAHWTCTVCGAGVAVETAVCPTCGSSIYRSFGTDSQMPAPADALRAGIVPGYGLTKVGRPGEGLIVGILAVFTVLGGVVIVFAGEPLGTLLILSGLAIWLVAARDAHAVAAGEEAWLHPRALTFVAVIVLVVLAISLMRALPGAIR